MKTKLLLLFGALILLSSCGSKKIAEARVNHDQKIRPVLRGHDNNAPEFKTLEASIRAGYKTDDQDRSISLSMRIKKNDTIWLSAKIAGMIPLAKVLITKKQVQYYDKINGVYFKGNYAELSDWLGTDLDYQKVQNLLVGQALYSLKDEKWDYDISERGYQLKSKPGKSIDKSFLIQPESYRLKAEQFVREAEQQSVTITYPEYQQVGDEVFPQKIEILANQKADNSKISIYYKSVNFDADLSFPYEVPENYERTTIIN